MPPATPHEIEQATQRIEEEKAEKQRLRQEKKDAKEAKQKQLVFEKLLAPLLLLLTLIISAMVMTLSN